MFMFILTGSELGRIGQCPILTSALVTSPLSALCESSSIAETQTSLLVILAEYLIEMSQAQLTARTEMVMN